MCSTYCFYTSKFVVRPGLNLTFIRAVCPRQVAAVSCSFPPTVSQTKLYICASAIKNGLSLRVFLPAVRLFLTVWSQTADRSEPVHSQLNPVKVFQTFLANITLFHDAITCIWVHIYWSVRRCSRFYFLMTSFTPKLENSMCIWCLLIRDRLHGVITQNTTFRSYITVVSSGLVDVSVHAMARLVEALSYKPERRGFDSRWWNFPFT
jgi:hypothetical protein